MDILINLIISIGSTGWIIEFIGSFLKSDRWLKRLGALPLAYGNLWLLGVTGPVLIVSGLASAFVTLTILHLLSRPVTINTINRR